MKTQPRPSLSIVQIERIQLGIFPQKPNRLHPEKSVCTNTEGYVVSETLSNSKKRCFGRFSGEKGKTRRAHPTPPPRRFKPGGGRRRTAPRRRRPVHRNRPRGEGSLLGLPVLPRAALPRGAATHLGGGHADPLGLAEEREGAGGAVGGGGGTTQHLLLQVPLPLGAARLPAAPRRPHRRLLLLLLGERVVAPRESRHGAADNGSRRKRPR